MTPIDKFRVLNVPDVHGAEIRTAHVEVRPTIAADYDQFRNWFLTWYVPKFDVTPDEVAPELAERWERAKRGITATMPAELTGGEMRIKFHADRKTAIKWVRERTGRHRDEVIRRRRSEKKQREPRATTPEELAGAERREAWYCENCDTCHEEAGSALYECPKCETTYNRDHSSDGDSARCPDCNRVGGKVANESCPDCDGEPVESVQAVVCRYCEEMVAEISYGDHLDEEHSDL